MFKKVQSFTCDGEDILRCYSPKGHYLKYWSSLYYIYFPALVILVSGCQIKLAFIPPICPKGIRRLSKNAILPDHTKL